MPNIKNAKLVISLAQGSFLPEHNKGVCLGLATYAIHNLRLHDKPNSWQVINQFKSIPFFEQSGIKYQELIRSPYLDKKAFPLKTNQAYLASCIFDLQPGYLTKYSLKSYFAPSAWLGDHALALLGCDDGSTIVYDPNLGVVVWEQTPIEHLQKQDLEQMIEGQFRAFSSSIPYENVYVPFVYSAPLVMFYKNHRPKYSSQWHTGFELKPTKKVCRNCDVEFKEALQPCLNQGEHSWILSYESRIPWMQSKR